MPVADTVKRRQYVGYISWYSPIPFPPIRLVSGIRYNAPITFAINPPVAIVNAPPISDCFLFLFSIVTLLVVVCAKRDFL